MIVLISVTVALLSVIGTLYLSQKVRGWVSVYDSAPCSFSDIPPLHGKIAIVTGINTGIGLVTARELLIKGRHTCISSILIFTFVRDFVIIRRSCDWHCAF